MSSGSIRKRILTIAALTIAVTLAAAGAALILVFEQHVLKRIAIELEIRSSELAKAFELDADGNPQINHDLADARYQLPYGGAYWQISEGAVQHLRSRSLWDQILDTSTVKGEDKSKGAFEIDGPNNSELYVLERSVKLDGADGPRTFQLAVALDHADIGELRHAFSLDVAKILFLLALLLIGGAWLQMRFGLRPLHQLRASLTAVREGCTSRLTGTLPEEIKPLVDDLNRLLDRQDELVRKARDRAGLLAHGLKTPLTILSSEVARLEKSGQHTHAAILREQCEAIGAHVERELARARTHGAIQAVSMRTLVLPIVNRLVDLMSRIDSADSISWSVTIPEHVSAAMETDDFAEVVGNLLDNARKWARSAVTVQVHAADGGSTVLSVSDDGPGVPGDRRQLILQRGVHFAPDSHHSSGLGLAIVSDTLAEYGRELIIADTETGCTISFEIEPPRRSERRQGDGTAKPRPAVIPSVARAAE